VPVDIRPEKPSAEGTGVRSVVTTTSGGTPVRFSIQIPLATDMASWRDKVRRAQDAGFYSLSLPDHLGPSLPQLAPMIALAAAAAVTERIRLAVTVLDNDFRHPVLVAKEAATLDLLSEGRLDLGLGAGWMEEDYTRTGVASFDPPATRVDRLVESIDLLEQLLGGDEVTFKGAFYAVEAFRSSPLPRQSPLPIMIGARGRRMLTIASRRAQIVSILAGFGAGNHLDTFEEQLGWIEAAGGRRRADLLVGLRIPFGRIAGPGESGPEVAAEFARQTGSSLEDAIASPFSIVGDLAMAREQLVTLRDRFGISYLTVSEDMGWALAPLVGELGEQP
jgi:probable F420-dependent oxidoreductase